MAACIEVIGQTFGRLTAISVHYVQSHAYAVCVCTCSKTITAKVNNLRTGNTRSCGCLGREAVVARNMKHGHSPRSGDTPEYRAWFHMHGRCNNKNDSAYVHYGARGIKVCERWNDFSAFLSDMGLRPSAGMSIDRIDVNGNYEPSNCRWATRDVQGNNRRNNIIVDRDGIRRTLTEYCRDTGRNYPATLHRIHRGASIDEALDKPFRKSSPRR